MVVLFHAARKCTDRCGVEVTRSARPGLLRKDGVHECDGCHRLHDGDRTRDDTRVVPAACAQDALFSVVLRGLLLLGDGRRRLEGDPEVDVLAVGDPALDAAAPVRLGAQRAVRLRHKGVVVQAAGHLRPAEARADFEALGRGDAHHRMRENRLELVEARLPETDRYVAQHAGDRAADRVILGLGGQNPLAHLLGDGRVWAAHVLLVDRVARDSVQEVQELVAHRELRLVEVV